jgi:NADH-quinone oxidoreductase subunit E
MPALWLAQEEAGWLSSRVFEEIGELLDLHPTDVASIASFYVMFHRSPIGKTLIEVCENPSCYLAGSDATFRAICKGLGLHANHVEHEMQTTADGKYSVRPTECLAACDYAPVVQVNLRFHGPVRERDAEAFLADPSRFSIEGRPSLSMVHGPQATPVDGWEANAPPPGASA